MPFVLLYLVVEIVALVALGSVIGLGWTLLVLLAGSVLGLLLARREGVRAAQALAGAVTSRQVAHVEVTDGLLVAAGGVLLFLPGLVTDLAGLLLVFRPTRAIIRRRLVRAAEERSPGLRTARIRSAGPVVDGDVVNGDVVNGDVVNGDAVNGDAVNGDAVKGDVLNGDVVNGDATATARRHAEPRAGGPLIIEGTVVPGPANEPG